MSRVVVRFYDLAEEGAEAIFSLFDRVYGDSAAIRQRWKWEWLQHPEAEKIKIVVAEADDSLIGMTVRMPVHLSDSGVVVDAWFATNSMVDPRYRGQGIIQQLYKTVNAIGGIQLSKGTAEGMFRQLLKMGYQQILPDTYQICLLAPWQWFKQKIGMRLPAIDSSKKVAIKEIADYHQVVSFPEELNSLQISGVVAPIKTAAWLNWRYVDIPHRHYHLAIREIEGRIVSWCVIRVQGRTAYLVDFRCVNEQNDEPLYTIRYVKHVAKKLGVVKLVAWGTEPGFRRSLSKLRFVNRQETPHFSFKHENDSDLSASRPLFMMGDGDSEYL